MLVGLAGAAVIVGGLVLGIWALKRQKRQFPKGTHVRTGERQPSEIESKTTWLSGGRS